jgi:hypothetical protein
LRQIARGQLTQSEDEVSVNVIRMILILDERAVRIDFADADLPELLREDLEVIDQPVAPAGVPCTLGSVFRATDEYRPAKLVKGHFVVSSWKEAVWLKGRYVHDFLLSPIL